MLASPTPAVLNLRDPRANELMNGNVFSEDSESDDELFHESTSLNGAEF